MTKEAQRIGRKAEERVYVLAIQNQIEARFAEKEEDYGGKTDLFIDDQPVQVSVSKKSNKQRKRLESLGIRTIVAGESETDESILEQIASLRASLL